MDATIELRVLWAARRSNQSTLKEVNPEYSLEGLMLKLKLQYFGHVMRRADSLDLDRTTKTKLIKSGESRHFCLVSDFRGKAFGFLQSSMMLAVYFSYGLNYVEIQSFYTYFVKEFFL